MNSDYFQARYENFLQQTGETHINILKAFLNSPPSITNTKLAEILHQTQGNVSKRLKESIQCFFEISKSDYQDLGRESQKELKDQLSTLFAIYKRHDYAIHPERLEYLEEKGYLRPVLENIDSYVPLNSRYYLKRGYVEEDSFELIERPRSLLRITGCHKNGKTSLLKRILDYSDKKLEYHTVDINLKELENSGKSNLRDFLDWFCNVIRNQSKINNPPPIEHKQTTGLLLRCGNYVEKILKETPTGLVIALDNIDSLFEFPHVCNDFLSMLRVWHEKSGVHWRKLKVILAYTNDYDGDLEIHKSPFNVGEEIKLPEFSDENIKTLIIRYGLPITPIESETWELMQLLAGIPHLTRLGLQNIASGQISTKTILNQAHRDQGIFNEHLFRILDNLNQNSQLEEEMKKIVHSDKPINIDIFVAKKLLDKGFIKQVDQKGYVTRCQLYQKYLGQYL